MGPRARGQSELSDVSNDCSDHKGAIDARSCVSNASRGGPNSPKSCSDLKVDEESTGAGTSKGGGVSGM